MAQFYLKIAHLSFSMGPTPPLKMALSYGLHPRLWLLVSPVDKVLEKSVREIFVNFQKGKNSTFSSFKKFCPTDFHFL